MNIFHRLQRKLDQDLGRQLANDMLIFGTAYHTAVPRKWWNPMRFLLGEIKRRRVDPLWLFHHTQDRHLGKIVFEDKYPVDFGTRRGTR